MCKSIKKSCFVIVVSFMSFSFYSGDVSSDFLVQVPNEAVANAPRNSALKEQEKITAVINAYDPATGARWSERVRDLTVGQPFKGFKPKPNVEYSIQLFSKGKSFYSVKKLMPQSLTVPELKVDVPVEAVRGAAPQAGK